MTRYAVPAWRGPDSPQTSVPICDEKDPDNWYFCELPRGHAGDHEAQVWHSRTWDDKGWTDD